MPRHHRERLSELETLLEFPTQVSAEELDSRYQDLCKVLEKARDTFNCRLDEEEDNPFQELRAQLQKAKDWFHVRLADENNTNPLWSSRFKTKNNAKNVQNPFQELRNAFRMARKQFIPLIDQYIATGNNYNTHAIRELAGSRLDGRYLPTTAVDVNSANVDDSSTMLRTNPIDHCSKPWHVNACKEISTSEPVSIASDDENAVDYYRTILSQSLIEDCSKPSILCKEMISQEKICVEINKENIVDPCHTILSAIPVEDCAKPRPSNAWKEISSRETAYVEINKENAMDCRITQQKCHTQQPLHVYEGMSSVESSTLEVNKESVVDYCCTNPSTSPMEDLSTTQPSNACIKMSSIETLSVEMNKNDVVDSYTIRGANPTEDYCEHRPLYSCHEVSSKAAPNRLGREEMPHESFSETVISPNNAKAGHLEAMITKELQRRKGGVELHRNDEDHVPSPEKSWCEYGFRE